MSKLCSCEWQYRSHRRPQSVTLNSWEVKEMVMEIIVMPGIKVKIKAMARDATARESNVFDVKAGDIQYVSA